jgi:hypothetical protein
MCLSFFLFSIFSFNGDGLFLPHNFYLRKNYALKAKELVFSGQKTQSIYSDFIWLLKRF